jgi:hypothetical protein
MKIVIMGSINFELMVIAITGSDNFEHKGINIWDLMIFN